ncbi:MAG: hypothetical protein LBE56_12765 [Tannerella sp.]|nr:hypothetical protein [Tannerella sp.]
MQGYDANGAPNLVEENEVKWNDYIFSNRLVIPKGVKDAALPTNIQDKTFAEAAQVLSADTEERPFDPVAKRGLEVMLGRLAQLQEVVRMEQAEMEAKAEAEAEDEEMMEAARYFAFGGDIRDSDEYKLRIQSLLDRNKREWQRYKKQYPDSDDEEVARYLYRRDNRWNPLNTEFVSGDKRLQQFVNEEAARNGVPASVLYNQISNSGMIDRHVAAVKDG